MAVYIIVIVVVLLILVGAYRALGGAPPQAGEAGALLRSLHAELGGTLAALSTAITSSDDPTGEDTARDGRKVGAAVQQSLDRLPPAAELDAGDAAARALLAAAAEDTAWAWRLLQATSASPALRAAATVLADHAASCCAEAEALLAVPVGGEPVDGP